MARRAAGVSEVRIRVGGVEVAVAGVSREACLRQLERAVRAVDAGEAEAPRNRLLSPVTSAGAASPAGWRDAQGQGH